MGSVLTCTATTISSGSRVNFVEADVDDQDGRLVARAQLRRTCCATGRDARRRRLTVALRPLVALLSGGAAAVSRVRRPAATADPTSRAGRGGAVAAPGRRTSCVPLIAGTRAVDRVDTLMRIAVGRRRVSWSTPTRPRCSAVNPDQPLTPASSLKLTTAAAFLAKAGGKGHFDPPLNGRQARRDGHRARRRSPGRRRRPPAGDDRLRRDAQTPAEARDRHSPASSTRCAAPASRASPAASTSSTALRQRAARPVVERGLHRHRRRRPDRRARGRRRLQLVRAAHRGTGSRGRGRRGSAPRSSPPASRSTAPSPASARRRRPTTIASIESAPYADIVGEMLRESDNNTAEVLLKELARRGVRQRRHACAGRRRAPRGAAPARDRPVGRAGDRRLWPRPQRPATCNALLATLTTKPGGYDLEDMLAVAGQTGTLDDRFTTSPLAGKLARQDRLARTASPRSSVSPTRRRREAALRLCLQRRLQRRRRQGAAGPTRRHAGDLPGGARRGTWRRERESSAAAADVSARHRGAARLGGPAAHLRASLPPAGARPAAAATAASASCSSSGAARSAAARSARRSARGCG